MLAVLFIIFNLYQNLHRDISEAQKELEAGANQTGHSSFPSNATTSWFIIPVLGGGQNFRDEIADQGTRKPVKD